MCWESEVTEETGEKGVQTVAVVNRSLTEMQTGKKRQLPVPSIALPVSNEMRAVIVFF